jgi:hypothetical protein
LRLARDDAGFIPVVRHFLGREAHRLRAHEPEFLEWATAQDADPMIRYYALQWGENLREDSLAWQRRLAGFAQSEDPYLRLHALAALSRRGEPARIAEIIHTATTADHLCVRAEALRILAETDARQHRPLLHQAMLEQTARCDRGGHRAVFEEAWRGLMRLDPPEALTELLQLSLALPGLQPRQESDLFQALLSVGEAKEIVDQLFEPRWWRCGAHREPHDWVDLPDAERRLRSHRLG